MRRLASAACPCCRRTGPGPARAHLAAGRSDPDRAEHRLDRQLDPVVAVLRGERDGAARAVQLVDPGGVRAAGPAAWRCGRCWSGRRRTGSPPRRPSRAPARGRPGAAPACRRARRPRRRTGPVCGLTNRRSTFALDRSSTLAGRRRTRPRTTAAARCPAGCASTGAPRRTCRRTAHDLACTSTTSMSPPNASPPHRRSRTCSGGELGDVRDAQQRHRAGAPRAPGCRPRAAPRARPPAISPYR